VRIPQAVVLACAQGRHKLGDDEGHPLRHRAGNEMHVAAQAGSPFMLCLRQFAFPHNTLMLFVCTLDAILKLAPIVRELLGHYIRPASEDGTARLSNFDGAL
jgi:hypothetical protein